MRPSGKESSICQKTDYKKQLIFMTPRNKSGTLAPHTILTTMKNNACVHMSCASVTWLN